MKITREKTLPQVVAIFLTVVLVFGVLPVMAWAETDSDAVFKYTAADGKATITGVESFGSDRNLVIPGTLGDATVTCIGEDAFARQDYIVTVTMADSITFIGQRAFLRCSNLTSATISKGVTALDKFVFADCTSLESVTIPVGVGSIRSEAFNDSPNVTICGSEGSKAHEFATVYDIPFISDGTYAVVFDKNGGDTEAIPSIMSVAGGDTIGTLPAAPTRGQFRFAGWNTKVDGSGTTITADTVINEPLHVYAQWTMDTPEGFNNNDFQRLLAFALQGENATKLDWDLTKPGTWAGITWNNAAEKRVTAIDCHGSSSAPENGLTGSLYLSGCTFLEELNCAFNNLGSLNVVDCTALTDLSCHHNFWLDSLDITGCTALKYLNCSESNLSSLDISSCTALEELSCSYNNLEILDVSGLTALTELSCYANYLTSLNVTNCSALAYLDCEDNELSSLNASSCTLLVGLDCSYNALETLDVSGYSDLVELWCVYNELESLDVSDCTALEELGCYGNALTSVDISGCSALTYLDCEDNADLELIWGLNQVKNNTDFKIYMDEDQSLADLLAKEQAVLAVNSQIDTLPAVGELTLADEELVSAAESAYNGLSPVQKRFVSNGDKLVAAKNKIIELKAPPTYTLTITAGIGGSITTGSSNNYAAGTVIDITATPASGYSFNKWTSTGGGTFANANSASTTYTMPANPATITAGFTYQGSGGGSSGGGGGTTPAGTPVSTSGRTASVNGVTLTFPAGAVENDIRVQVKEGSLTAGMTLPDNSQLLCQIMDIIKNKSGNFLKPVTITLSFDKSGLNPDEYDIAIYYYDEDAGKWIALDNIRLNLEDGTISGDTTHFTKFAVIATPKVIKEEKPTEPVTPQPAVNIPGDISDHWAKDGIVKLMKAGIVSGYPDGTFQPNKAVTRAEFTVILVRALNLEPVVGNAFTDTNSHWAKESISTAAACGLISGYDQNTFGPNDLITREQAAVIIARAAQLEAAGNEFEELNFTDSQAISSWARSGVAAAFQGGFISGYPDGSFRPQGHTTRAEATVIIGKLR